MTERDLEIQELRQQLKKTTAERDALKGIVADFGELCCLCKNSSGVINCPTDLPCADCLVQCPCKECHRSSNYEFDLTALEE